MTSLNILVEGVAEETFVETVLAGHLARESVFASASRVQTRRKRGVKYSGGGITYERVKGELSNWLKQDQEVHFTTMFDLYRLHKGFPGFDEATRLIDPLERVAMLEHRLAADIGSPRLIPYIQLNEFEALLLTDPNSLEHEFPSRTKAIEALTREVSPFSTPEYVNDTTEGAPSKRIQKWIPEYAGRKASAGPSTVAKIGLAAIRAKCSHFDAWLTRLESLGES